MKKIIPLFLTVLITSFLFISCTDDSGSSLTNNNTSGNHAPETPKNPFPSDNAANVVRFPLTIAWVCSDPDAGDTVKYDVWMANINPPDHTLATGLTVASYSLPYLLAADTDFYWRIVAKDNNGATTSGPVWKFTTGSVVEVPELLSPADGAASVPLTPTFRWNNPGSKIQIDYNPAFNPPVYSYDGINNATSYSLPPQILQNNSTYYWRVGLVSGSITYWSGSIFRFTTG